MPTSQLATCSPAHQPLIQGQGWQDWNDSLGERLPDLINLPQSQSFFTRHCLEAVTDWWELQTQGEWQHRVGWCAFPMQILESQNTGRARSIRQGSQPGPK